MLAKELTNVLQSFRTRKDDELGEIAFLSMLEGSINEPTIFQEAWDHPDKNKCEAWRTAIKKEFSA